MYIFYTDGGCKPNPGKGGWAYAKLLNSNIKELNCGSKKVSTNNQMEAIAIIKALQSCKRNNERIHIISDSFNCVRYIKQVNEGQDIYSKNSNDEFNSIKKALQEEIKRQDVTSEWVKAHSNSLLNQVADNLATMAMKN